MNWRSKPFQKPDWLQCNNMEAVIQHLKTNSTFVFRFVIQVLYRFSNAHRIILVILILASSLLTLQYMYIMKETTIKSTNQIARFSDDFQNRISAADRAVNQRKKEYDLLYAHVTCVKFAGGLGNNMFQYASSYGIARAIGLDIVIFPTSSIYQVFKPVARVTVDPKLCSQLKTITERASAIFDVSILSLKPDSDYRFQHYLQSWKYFEHVKEEIRHQFQFREDIVYRANMEISGALSTLPTHDRNQNLYVGVHVRRGNYLEPFFFEFGYKVANMTYINKAMTYFKSKYPYNNVIFLVLSNDMWWCKRNINRPDVHFIESNSTEVDLAILSLLNHTIITVGTFGFWGAWLSNGHAVYMKDFFVNGSRYSKEFWNLEDYFPSQWVGL